MTEIIKKIEGPIKHIYKNRIWFDQNPDYVLRDGQIVYLDGVGTYKMGNKRGSKLKDLDFLPKISSTVNNYTSGSSNQIIVEKVVSQITTKGSLINADGSLADSALITGRGKALGLVMEDTASGFTANVITSGEFTNDTWSWSIGDKIYLNGTSLSNVAPVTGYVQKLGVAKASNIIEVNISPSILI